MTTRRPAPPRARRARVAVALLFACNGAVLAGAVTRYPDIKDRLDLSNASFGLAVGAYWVGALVVGLAAGALVVRLGSARVAWVATVVAALALVGVGLSPTWLLLAAALLVGGSADAVADVAENDQGLRVERLHGRSVLNSLHAMWSIGAVSGGAVGAAAAARQVPVALHLGGVALVVVLTALLAARWLLPDDGHGARSEATVEGATAGPTGVVRTLWRVGPAVLVLGAVACSAQVMEDVGATWAALYLRGEAGAAAGTAGLAFVALQGTQTVSRLVADRLVTRFGDVACARVGAGLAGTAMTAALLWPTAWGTVVAFGVVGLGIGSLIPAAMRAADAVPGLRPGSGLTAVSTVIRVGILPAAPLVGLVADATSLRLALGVVPLLAVLVVLLAGHLRGDGATGRGDEVAPAGPGSPAAQGT